MDFGYQKVCFPGFRAPKPVFLIPRPSTFWIPVPWCELWIQGYCWDSRFHLNRFRIPKGPFFQDSGFLDLYSWFQDQIFSGFLIPWCGLRIQGTAEIQDSTSVDSGFQKFLFPGFRISRTGFQIPRPIFSGFQIPRATVFWIPDSGLYFILHGTKFLVWASNLDSPAGTHGFLDPQEPSSH